ncbi:MAG: hypothetical protein MI742_07100, partial [Desulfobacterales bacterium]|nr:hypothetical protein [Desulfobacterales bacterium]
VDAFKEIPNPNKQMAFMQPTIFTPVETNLKKLLNHYGVHVKSAYIMDEKCYKQALPRRFGGGQQTLYYIPIIENEKINHELPFLRQIKGLVTLKASPVTLDEKRIQSQNLKAETLFSTSDRSWTQSRNITLNTMTIRPPADESAFSSQPVAVMVQGEFTSYFADKTIPEKPSNPSESGSDKGKEKSQVSQSGAILTKGRPARLVVVGSVDMLTNSLFDEKAQSPNGAFIMNLMDATAGRESIAVMRGKKQRFNPLKKIPESVKMPIKIFNYAGLPLFTALFGLGVYLRRHRRRKAIQAMFIEPTMPKLSCEESSTLAG